MADGIVVKQLNAWFGAAHVLKDVDLTMPPNGVTAIIGPSGCGKSTFIRCINRMHEVVRGARVTGQVLLDGEDIYASHVDPVAVRRRVGMVFQRANPFPTMSIFDNVAAGLRLAGTTRKALLDDAVEQSAAKAALWDEVKDQPGRRPAFASPAVSSSASASRAPWRSSRRCFCLDEPCSALDPIATAKIEELIRELKKQLHDRHRDP